MGPISARSNDTCQISSSKGSETLSLASPQPHALPRMTAREATNDCGGCCLIHTAVQPLLLTRLALVEPVAHFGPQLHNVRAHLLLGVPPVGCRLAGRLLADIRHGAWIGWKEKKGKRKMHRPPAEGAVSTGGTRTNHKKKVRRRSLMVETPKGAHGSKTTEYVTPGAGRNELFPSIRKRAVLCWAFGLFK